MEGMSDLEAESVRLQLKAMFIPDDPEIIPLNVGSPGMDQIKRSRDVMAAAMQSMLEAPVTSYRELAFQYGISKGDFVFRTELANFLEQQTGFRPDPENLLATGGCSQSVHFASSVFLRTGMTVFVEDPTFYSVTRIFTRDLKLNVIPVPTDKNGLIVEKLEKLIKKHVIPKKHERQMFTCMLYIISVFHNPTGRCLHPDRCRKLVQIARKYDMLILTDDVYTLLQFDGRQRPPPRLVTYDSKTDPDYKGNVISCGSFSKILSPGIRLGWLESGDRIIQTVAESGLFVAQGGFNQFGTALVAEALKQKLVLPHLRFIRQILYDRMTAICDILEEQLPFGCEFVRPKGGYFVWVKLPDYIDTSAMLNVVRETKKVTFLPGNRSSPGGGNHNFLRICFGYLEKEVMMKGVRDLCDGIQNYMEEKQEDNQQSSHL